MYSFEQTKSLPNLIIHSPSLQTLMFIPAGLWRDSAWGREAGVGLSIV